MCFFFFSSRRRHTRLQGDWSSDVCSSDLALERRRILIAAERRQTAAERQFLLLRHQGFYLPRAAGRGREQSDRRRRRLAGRQIGRASCRERVWIWGVGGLVECKQGGRNRS